jgi:Uma2 family endonuclease
MNAPIIPPLERRRFTTEDVFRMVAAGVIKPDERVELIEGELRGMSPKHNKHEWLKARLAEWLTPHMRPRGPILAQESTLYLDARTFVEPDFIIYRRDIMPEDVRGGDVELAIEIGDTSLKFDLKTKALLYARYGIRHYWAIDAETLTTHVHSAPSAKGYPKPVQRAKDEALTFPFAAELTLKLAELR